MHNDWLRGKIFKKETKFGLVGFKWTKCSWNGAKLQQKWTKNCAENPKKMYLFLRAKP